LIQHIEFQNRQPEWRAALGAATSIAIPREGIAAILPRIIDSLIAFNVLPRPQPNSKRIEQIEKALEELKPPSQALAVSPIYRRVFVGREQALKHMQALFDSAISCQGALAVVVGETGIGKTAFCEQLATHVSLSGGRTLVSHCYEKGSLSLPYLAFVEALRSYVLSRPPEALRKEMGTGAAAGAGPLKVQEVLDPQDKSKRCDLLLPLGNVLQVSGQPRRVIRLMSRMNCFVSCVLTSACQILSISWVIVLLLFSSYFTAS
jgi:hypothetical protein